MFYDVQILNEIKCKNMFLLVDGGWSDWGEWGLCTYKSALNEAREEKERTCTNPAPANGGNTCGTDNMESRVSSFSK